MMQPKEFQTLYRAQPFRPFVLRLADGRSVRVDHSEFMTLSSNGRSANVYLKDGSFEIINIVLVLSAEVVYGARGRKWK